MIRSSKLKLLVFLLCFMFALSAVGYADNSVVFNFNGISLSSQGAYSYTDGESGNYQGNDTTVSSTLNTQFQATPAGSGNKLTVSSNGLSTGTSPTATNNWLGDGHVVGGINGSLGAGGKTYLINTNGQEFSGSNTGFVFNFTNAAGTLQDNFIHSVTFTYEIFPDGTCPSSSNCTTIPDFELFAGTSTSAIQNAANLIYSKNGCAPGSSGCPVTSTVSPNSPSGGELAPQLGPTTVSFFFSTPVSVLDFEDWPQTIGVSNLQINTPEPGSLLLLGIGLTGLAVIRRRYVATSRSI